MKLCCGCMEKYADELNVCPHCGFAEGTKPENALHMVPGSILADRYVVGKVIGFGGFGVTYIGWDKLLETKVAIKEYLPSEFSTRVLGHTVVTVFSGDKQEQFNDGMKRFIDEAKKLAKFHSTPGIVKIFDSFEYNNTAYIIMELLEGETLADKLKRGETFSEDKAVEMMIPVIQSLEKVHSDGIIHRDIAPDNIFITNSGSVKLIDFGAARYATTTHSRSLTVIIKPGYSPEEQYRSRGDQGAYTDVYSLAATMYRMITGQTPPDALERRAFFENKKKDVLEPLHKYKKNIDQDKENAILNALNVRIEDRTPNMETFLYELTTNDAVERKAGTIKKLDVFGWPLWAKIAIPAVAALLIVFAVVMSTVNFGVEFEDNTAVPEGYTRVRSVLKMDFDEAKALMKEDKINLELGGKYPNDMIEENHIMTQDHREGSIIQENAKVIVYVAGRGLQQVPDVRGCDVGSARSLLEQLGFEVVEEESYDSVIAEGCVISQSEDPFEEVDDHSRITLKISKGADLSKSSADKDVKMPNLVGMSYEDAVKAAEKLGLHLKVKAHKYSRDHEKFAVMTQSVNADSSVNTSKVVELEVSLGFDQVKVPDVTYMSEEEAQRYLLGRGLKHKRVEEDNEDVPEGHVISHNPKADTKVDPESVITVKISTGSAAFAMPDVVGKNEQEALRILKDENGLVVTPVYEENDSKPEGEVLKQSKNAGVDVRKGDEIIITVCTHSSVVKVPDVTGKPQSDAEKAIKAAGLKVSVTKAYSDKVAKGNVIKSNPTAGSGLKKGDTVVITVSDGKNTTNSVSSNSSDAESENESKGTESREVTGVITTLVSATGVKLSQSSMDMAVDTTAQLTAEMTPGNASDTLTWSSSDPSIASVNNGLVSAHKAGTATITVKTGSGKTASCKVNVKTNEVLPSSVSLDIKSITRTEGDTFQLKATLSPGNVTNHTITWKSDDPNVASVDNNGKVTAKKAGSTTIIVSTVNGKTAVCSVTVNAKAIMPESIQLDKTTLVMYPGDSTKLTATISPSNAEDKRVTWSSTSEDVIFVSDNGIVTAYAEGYATITVTTSNGKKAECTVTVKHLEENSKLTDSGTLGDVQWQLFETGNLYIFGNGNMGQHNFNNSGIKRVIIRDGVTSVCDTAFNNCTELESVEIGNSVNYIGERAFYNCSSLSSLSLPQNLNEIGNRAFAFCIDLQSVEIPSSVTKIDDGAFEKCSGMTSLRFDGGEDNSLERIGDSAFSNCASISDIVLPSRVNYIGNYAFYNCSRLIKFCFSGDQPEFGGENFFDGCDDITVYYPRDNSTWDNFESEYWNRPNDFTAWDPVL